MKKLILSLPLLLLPLVLSAQAWSLEDCIDYAIVHNPEILHRQVQYDNQAEILKEAKTLRVPIINIGVQETIHTGNALIMYSVDENLTMSLTQVAASLEMPLYSGGAIPNKKKSEDYKLKASEQNIIVSKINTRIRVAAAYLQLLNDKSREDIARRQVDLCESELENVKKLVDQGKRTDADLAQAYSSLSSAQHMLTSASGNALMSKVNLANLIGLDDETGFDISELSGDVEDFSVLSILPLMSNLDSHPTVRSAQYSLSGAEYGAKAARGALYPQLSLFANYNNYFYLPFGGPDIRIGSQLGMNGWGSLGVKLAVPILDLGAQRRVSRASIAYNDARIALDESRREVSKQLREAYYQTVTAKERYNSSLKAEKAAHDAFEYQEKMYAVGRGTIYDLDQSRLKWLSACEESSRAKYEYLLRNKIIEYYSIYSQEQ